uniref:Uncharacterized protein n=1 Tax=Molossus molossus TaxID=27622 RepID=A0A7J8CZ90_MOLMO|nr:hypothetical protein HJG59_009488 [Molossus molossus]
MIHFSLSFFFFFLKKKSKAVQLRTKTHHVPLIPCSRTAHFLPSSLPFLFLHSSVQVHPEVPVPSPPSPPAHPNFPRARQTNSQPGRLGAADCGDPSSLPWKPPWRKTWTSDQSGPGRQDGTQAASGPGGPHLSKLARLNSAVSALRSTRALVGLESRSWG